MCAFPLHVWALLLSFRDVSWLSARTNLSDAIGVISYGMVFAFVETIFVFLIALLLGMFISSKWESQKRIALLGSLAIVTALWSIFSQLYFMLGWSFPSALIDFLVRSRHPARIFYPILIALVGSSVIYPAYAILRSEKAYAVVRDLMERISLLTTVYLIIDVMAFCVVIFRNV